MFPPSVRSLSLPRRPPPTHPGRDDRQRPLRRKWPSGFPQFPRRFCCFELALRALRAQFGAEVGRLSEVQCTRPCDFVLICRFRLRLWLGVGVAPIRSRPLVLRSPRTGMARSRSQASTRRSSTRSPPPPIAAASPPALQSILNTIATINLAIYPITLRHDVYCSIYSISNPINLYQSNHSSLYAI